MKVLLLGLGRANTAVAKYLLRRGDEVYLFEERLSGLAQDAQDLLADHKVSLFREEPCELVVASPGFPEPPNRPNSPRQRTRLPLLYHVSRT